jgi:hypothetical protein
VDVLKVMYLHIERVREHIDLQLCRGGYAITTIEILAKLHEKLPSPAKSQTSGRRAMQPAWLAIGDALAELEGLSSRAENGLSWQQFLLDELEAQGHQVTLGHLHKLKRVRNFVRRYPGERPMTDADIYKAQISAIEIAERLHTLGADAGWKMFEECLDGLSFADAKRQYDKFQDEHRDRLPPRQAAWRKKRELDPQDSDLEGPEKHVKSYMIASAGERLGLNDAQAIPFNPSYHIGMLSNTAFGIKLAEEDGGIIFLGCKISLGVSLKGDDFVGVLESLLFQASFFDQYFFVTDAQADLVAELNANVKRFGGVNIGILMCTPEGTIAKDGTGLKMRTIEPVPDRRRFLVNAMMLSTV